MYVTLHDLNKTFPFVSLGKLRPLALAVSATEAFEFTKFKFGRHPQPAVGVSCVWTVELNGRVSAFQPTFRYRN